MLGKVSAEGTLELSQNTEEKNRDENGKRSGHRHKRLKMELFQRRE